MTSGGAMNATHPASFVGATAQTTRRSTSSRPEMSIDTTPLRHSTLRTDGFASVRARADTSEMLTHQLRSSASRWL